MPFFIGRPSAPSGIYHYPPTITGPVRGARVSPPFESKNEAVARAQAEQSGVEKDQQRLYAWLLDEARERPGMWVFPPDSTYWIIEAQTQGQALRQASELSVQGGEVAAPIQVTPYEKG